MFKKTLYGLISLGIFIPAVISGAALDRYSVPGQSVISDEPAATVPRPGRVNEEVYQKFRRDVEKYDQAQKEKLKKYYSGQLRRAVKGKNMDAALHYEKLIAILNEEE